MMNQQETAKFLSDNSGNVQIVATPHNDLADVYLNGRWYGELIGNCIFRPNA